MENLDRDIYEYFNGERQVFGDPIALWRRFHVACEGTPEEWIKSADDSEQPLRAADFAEKLLAAVRTVFKLVPFDDTTGKGAQDHDAYAALEGLVEFFAQKKTR